MENEVLEAIVNKKDAQEIKNMLIEQKSEGNRFVSFPTGKAFLTKEDFTPFKKELDAMEHAHKNLTEYYVFKVLPIETVEKEIENILENKKEQAKEPDGQRGNKRSRDQDLSR